MCPRKGFVVYGWNLDSFGYEGKEGITLCPFLNKVVCSTDVHWNGKWLWQNFF